jgi:putative iron-dependent peroxidase
MPTPQPGIFGQGTIQHRHLEFDVDPTAGPADLRRSLGDLQGLLASPTTNVVIGFGPDTWRPLGGVAPASFTGLPEVSGVARTQHDLWVWLHGAGDGALFDASLAAVHAAGCFHLVAETACFTYRDSRDLTGFVDGTQNPPVTEAATVAVIADDEPGAGGSIALTQRWVHDLASFHALSESEQEGVIGRTKADSIELADHVKPPTAHIARVVIEEDGEELEIYRRSAPYATVAEHGLYFVAFSADPTRFEKMLRRMFGQSDDGLHDRLTEFSRPVSGALYFVPSLDALAAVTA